MRVIIAIAGGVNLKGDILTEDACREAVLNDNRLEFDESTGNLYAEVEEGEAVSLPYPASWLPVPKQPRDKPDTPELMQECLGHLRRCPDSV